VYFECPMLCSLVLQGLAASIRQSGLEVGRDFDAVTVSFDPADGPRTAADRRRRLLASLGIADAPWSTWPFLTGTAPAVAELAASVGFGYAYDRSIRQFAHPAVIVVLTPDGRVARYLYGVEPKPRDLRLALAEAGAG